MKRFTAVLAAAVIMAALGGCTGNDNLKMDTDKSSVAVDISEEDKALLEEICGCGALVVHRDGSFEMISGEESKEYNILSIDRIKLSDEYYEMASAYKEYSSKEEYVAQIFEKNPQLEKFYDENGNLKNKNDAKIIIDFKDVTSDYNESKTDYSEEVFYCVGEWAIDMFRGDEDLRSRYYSAAEKSGFTNVLVMYEWDGNGFIKAYLYTNIDEEDIKTFDISM